MHTKPHPKITFITALRPPSRPPSMVHEGGGGISDITPGLAARRSVVGQCLPREIVGQFKVMLTLYPRNGGAARSLEALVDTGAGYSVVSRSLLEALGCRPITQRVVLADGRIEEWTVSQVELECKGCRAITPVLMGPPSGPALLGATTLEELGLGIDPLNRRRVPVDLYLP